MDLTWGIVLAAVGAGVFVIGARWWRRRRSAKLADKLLADVVKEKDSFRR